MSSLAAQNLSKDRLIEELRQQIEELRENEKDYADLNFLLTKLESRYQILNEEKKQQEQEFIEKSEVHIRQIANLKTESDTLKEALRIKQRELDEITAEVRAQRDVAEGKHLSTERLKTELKQAFETNQRLREDNQSMDTQLRWQKEEKRNLNDRIDQLTRNIEEVMEKNQDVERILEENEKDRRNIEQLQSNLQSEYDLLKEENLRKINALSDIESQCGIQMRQLAQLESEKNSKNAEIVRVRQRNCELESGLRECERQLESAYQELKQLQREHTQQLEENKLQRQEIEQHRKKGVDQSQTNNQLQGQIEGLNKRERELRQQSALFETQVNSLRLEVKEKNDLLVEMEESSSNALQNILRLEQENKDIIRDYDWIRQELDENNQKQKNEIERNLDLVNANRELEDYLRDRDRKIELFDKRENELRGMSEQLMEINRRQKKEIEQLQDQVEDTKKRQISSEQKADNYKQQIGELREKLRESENILNKQNQQLSVKENKMNEIEEQSQNSLQTLVKLEEEHRKQQKKNERLRQELLDAKERLDRADGYQAEKSGEIRQLQMERDKMMNEAAQKRELQERIRVLEDVIERMRQDNEIMADKCSKLGDRNGLLQEKMNIMEQSLRQLDDINKELNDRNNKLSDKVEELTDHLTSLTRDEAQIKQLMEKKRAIREARIREEQQLKISLSNLKNTISGNQQQLATIARNQSKATTNNNRESFGSLHNTNNNYDLSLASLQPSNHKRKNTYE